MRRPVRGLPRSRQALEFAEQAHAGQRRADGSAFIGHPAEVACSLYDAGAPDDVVAAGALHDVLEKTAVTTSELRAAFGDRITGLVLAVSDDPRITDFSERKAALRRQVAEAGDEALAVFAADKLSKARELARLIDADPQPDAAAGTERARHLTHYQRSVALLQERLPGSPMVDELTEVLGAAGCVHRHTSTGAAFRRGGGRRRRSSG
jgi:(p)ppGpp synthase/HD superfamily hydrolase